MGNMNHKCIFRSPLRVVLVWLLCLLGTCVRADDLAEIAALSSSGTAALALHLLDQNQPRLADDALAWMRWERRRIEIYQAHAAWSSLIERIEYLRRHLLVQMRASPTAQFWRWLQWQQARASLSQGDAMQALSLARTLLWESAAPAGDVAGADAAATAVPVADVRHLIVEAYLAQQQLADAHRAILRYRQDYPRQEEQWRTLYARILLQLGRATEVMELLRADRSVESQLLFYQAQIQGSALAPEKIRRKLLALSNTPDMGEREQHQVWLLLARAAHDAADPEAEINYLIKALTLPVQDTPDPAGAQIWPLLYDYGTQLGNEMQLLVGNHQAWMKKAQQLQKKHTIQAAALYTVLLTELDDAALRAQVHALFTNLLAREKYGYPLIKYLYVERRDALAQHTRVEDLPAVVRHRLVDDALLHADITLASQLMGDLQRPPQGGNLFDWNLRRARILIMGGYLEQGVQALYGLLEKPDAIPATDMDKLVQVIFDLQSVHRHEDAVVLLRRLLAAVPVTSAAADAKWRREMYYWIADSYKALQQYQDAARMYLRSALWLDAAAMDPWAQSARYQAADALARAGFREDAANLYRGLLQVTRDPGRRTVLQNRIQQLWLLPDATSPRQSAGDDVSVIH